MGHDEYTGRGPQGDGGNAGPGASHRDETGPSPVPGIDWQTFKNFVVRALNGDDTVPSAMTTLVNAALAKGETSLERRERDWWRDFLLRKAIEDQLREIDGLIDQYNKMADWHHGEAAKARGRMQEATDRLGEIDEFVTGVNEVFEDGRFDRKKVIALLKSRGVEVDPNADEAVLEKHLREEQLKALRERSQWSKQYDDAKADAGYHETEEAANRRKAQELVQKRDAIRGGGYDPEEEARHLKKVSEEYKLDIQRKADELESRRQGALQENTIASTSLDAAKKSQSSQAESEVSEFEALAGTLTSKFDMAAANVSKEAPPELTPPPHRPVPAGPASPA